MNFFEKKNAIKTMHIFPQSKLKGGGVEINQGVGLEINGGGVEINRGGGGGVGFEINGGWVCKLTGGWVLKFTYIQDHLMPRIKTLQVATHCSSWGPFTYIQDQVSWPIALVVAHLLIYKTKCGWNLVSKFTYIQDQVRW